MSFNIVTQMVPTKFIVNDYGEFPLEGLVELLDDLDDTEYHGNHVVIHNQELEQWLLDEDVIEKCAAGSCFRATNYVVFRKGLYSCVCGYMS